MNATPETPVATSGASPRRRILTLIAVLFVTVGLLWLLYWITVLAKRQETDDAYVNGDRVLVSAQVPGTVVAVLTDDTQFVEAGQELVRLDPTDAATSLSRAASQLGQAVRQVRQQKSTADQYDAQVATRRLELARAEADLKKREPLVAEQAIAGEEVRHAREAVELARAALNQSQRQAIAAHALVDGVRTAENPTVMSARDAYRDAWIAARRNTVVAPVSGFIAERSVQLGQRVAPGQPLLTVVPLNALWLDANFKEVQLRDLRIGQPVRIRSDLYGGGFPFHGKVEGLAAGTGAAFSLLPAQNASGNWIKVVQRVPVRVSIDPDELKSHPLRIGLSATVEVDTTGRDGPVLATAAMAHHSAATEVYVQDLEKANAEADAIIRRNLGNDQ